MSYFCAIRKRSFLHMGHGTATPFSLIMPFLTGVRPPAQKQRESKHWRDLRIWKLGDTDSGKSNLPRTCISSSLNLDTYYFPVETVQTMSILFYSIGSKASQSHGSNTDVQKNIKWTEKHDKYALENPNPKYVT